METSGMTIDRSSKGAHGYSGKLLATQNEVMPSAATRIQLEMATLSEVRDGDSPDSPAANLLPVQ